VIKSNLPARIAFRVTAKVDSRTILDTSGADKLLGMGDMLFLPPGRGQPMRALGALVTDDEVNAVVKAWSRQSKPEYAPDLQAHTEAAAQARGSGRVGSGQAVRAKVEAEAEVVSAEEPAASPEESASADEPTGAEPAAAEVPADTEAPSAAEVPAEGGEA
jgi:DNA segregation ATPase FtsK/SpoIIIE-like protein